MVRGRDDLLHTNMSALFPAGLTRNTVVIDYTLNSVSAAFESIFYLHSPGGGHATPYTLYITEGQTGTTIFIGDAATNASISVPAIVPGVRRKIAFSWQAGNISASLNGGAVATSTCTFTGVGTTALRLGSNPTTNYPSMVIAENGLTIIPGVYTTGAALQALSA